MRISDWSSDVCSSDLHNVEGGEQKDSDYRTKVTMSFKALDDGRTLVEIAEEGWRENQGALGASYGNCQGWSQMLCARSAEHTSELQSLMSISYVVSCLNKKKHMTIAGRTQIPTEG